MRTASVLALVVATLACGSEPPPSCGVIGRSAPCACPGGAQGAQECGPQGVWGVCVCPDGGVMEAGVDAGRDAGREGGVDRDAVVTPVDVDPGCDGGAPTRCGGACVDLNHDNANCGTCGRGCGSNECVFGVCQPLLSPDAGRCGRLTECDTPGFGLGCWDLGTSNGRVPANNCGACGRACPATAPRCVDGSCTEQRDGG